MNTTITAERLHTLLSEKACHLIDVREPVEHAEGHIVGAQLIPLGEIERRASEIGRDKPVVLMCRGGTRGGQALAKLQALGFSNALNLEGGMLAWTAAGWPTDHAAKKVFPLMQQVQMVIGCGVLLGVGLSLWVHPNWVFLSAFFGAGLVFAGSTGWCGLAILLSKMPWNHVTRHPSCTRDPD